MTQLERGPLQPVVDTIVDVEGVQKRTGRTLLASQICGGMGLVSARRAVTE
ncbi:MAG: hypothetical protein ACFCVK_17405 [Acidimicrobiales bacterium]